MMITLNTEDSRTAKAFELADQAAQWIKCRTADGHKAYGLRSSRNANQVYFVTASSCTCYDAQRHVRKHITAVQLHIARVKVAAEQPASDTIVGLAEMASQRHPTLDMIREPDGSIRWERHARAAGETVHLPRPVATAQRYDDIFKRFEDETPEQIFGRM